jgi:SAM-dependent methyltransferase
MTATPDAISSLKTRLKATWEAGNFGRFADYMTAGHLEIVERLGITPGTRMLDVACGAGQLALAAASKGAEVTGVDIASNSIAQARERARAAGVDARFDEGDAEALSYGDASFDLVTSVFGAMFAPRPELVAAELKRVCRPGGRIVMATWTPGGFVGDMFRAVGRHVPPPEMPSPTLWGDEATVRERLREGIVDLRLTERTFPMSWPFPPAEVVTLFREYFGPTNRAFEMLDAAGQEALRSDLEALWTARNTAGPAATAVAAEYLEVVATRA